MNARRQSRRERVRWPRGRAHWPRGRAHWPRGRAHWPRKRNAWTSCSRFCIRLRVSLLLFYGHPQTRAHQHRMTLHPPPPPPQTLHPPPPPPQTPPPHLKPSTLHLRSATLHLTTNLSEEIDLSDSVVASTYVIPSLTLSYRHDDVDEEDERIAKAKQLEQYNGSHARVDNWNCGYTYTRNKE
ncbi:MAG: hypothetical protein J3Q66DRAFT_86792 [Benniella sp.]|nr:MAG: hypothetical protein J3Q66DRAFT_86792 [Benniella sp.]